MRLHVFEDKALTENSGAKLISDGSELLLEILDPGIIGGLVLPIMGAIPDAAIIVVSGMFGSKEEAQRQIVSFCARAQPHKDPNPTSFISAHTTPLTLRLCHLPQHRHIFLHHPLIMFKAVGVGTLAGSTIMLLTIPWFASMILARCDFRNGRAVDGKCNGFSKSS